MFIFVNYQLSNILNAIIPIVQGGVPDLTAASRAILIDWNDGRIPFHTVPPQSNDIVESELVSEYAQEFDIEQLLHAKTIQQMDTE